MQKVEEKELKELQGGAGHYHWICKVGKILLVLITLLMHLQEKLQINI